MKQVGTTLKLCTLEILVHMGGGEGDLKLHGHISWT